MQTQERHYFEAINNFLRLLPEQYTRNYYGPKDILIDVDKVKLLGMGHNVSLKTDIWGCSASLKIEMVKKKGIVSVKEVTVSWSSTERSISSCLATIEFYRDILKVAAMIQAFIETHEVVKNDYPTKQDEEDAQNQILLNRCARVVVVYDDGDPDKEIEEKEFDSLEEAQQAPDKDQVTGVKLYDRNDHNYCHWRPDDFFKLDLKKLVAAV